MQLIIDNLKALGPLDYTGYIDADHLPRVTRRLNQSSSLHVELIYSGGGLALPSQGARVLLRKDDGTLFFGGYVVQEPARQYLGKGTTGDIARYTLQCESDEWLLDRKALPQRMPFVERTAGAILSQLTQDVAITPLDASAVAACDVIPAYSVDVQRPWSQHAAEVALRARAAYRAEDGSISLTPFATKLIAIDELSKTCDRSALKISGTASPLNDVTIVGHVEPGTFIKDYFEGDGYTLSFALAETPINIFRRTMLEEAFAGTSLNPVLWSVVSGSLTQVDNGILTLTGNACVELAELLEMGGGLELRHGCFEFQAASNGVLGGLYAGGLASANCVAGFSVQPSGAQSVIRAIVNGDTTGPSITTTSGHQYQFTTRVFADELHRVSQVYHSSAHGAGAAIGGETIVSDARVVLEVHDVDPNNPATMGAPSTVMYDGVLPHIPAFCNYALVNGSALHCSVSLTRMIKNGGVIVRAAIPGQAFRTLLEGSLVNGGECRVSPNSLTYLAAHVPEAAEQIVVSYRAGKTSRAEAQDTAAAAALENSVDDGVRSGVYGVRVPEARSTADCANAALALLDDGTQTGWQGEYTTWSDFLGAADVHPGDGVVINAASQNANFTAIVREVEIGMKDLASERSVYRIRFANESAEPLAYKLDDARLRLPPVGVVIPKNWILAPVKDAQFSQILDSQVTIATNLAPAAGGGFEVRGIDDGWGASNDRNLIGRFSAQTFTVPRLSRSQCYFVRQYDNAQPPNYSRDATLLHVDWPL